MGHPGGWSAPPRAGGSEGRGGRGCRFTNGSATACRCLLSAGDTGTHGQCILEVSRSADPLPWRADRHSLLAQPPHARPASVTHAAPGRFQTFAPGEFLRVAPRSRGRCPKDLPSFPPGCRPPLHVSGQNASVTQAHSSLGPPRAPGPETAFECSGRAF